MLPSFETKILLAILALIAAAQPAFAGAEAGTAAVTPVREAAARYGQALGAVEICFGAKITPKAEKLSASYSGSDSEIFKKQAAKIFDAWIKVKGCVRQDDPNQCKIIMDKSCEAAEAEIGPKGSAIPGLVEFAKQ